MLRPYRLTAPSHWAAYLINGDDSNLDPQEKHAVNSWLAQEGLGYPVSCEDAGFIRRHDASNFALASDCQEYVFLVSASSRAAA
ncbi:hypothetical protein M2322_002645 [Rhodoblastus acidophilus]|nr:hypothetical protein [Rhodoblastus acidophilus]